MNDSQQLAILDQAEVEMGYGRYREASELIAKIHTEPILERESLHRAEVVEKIARASTFDNQPPIDDLVALSQDPATPSVSRMHLSRALARAHSDMSDWSTASHWFAVATMCANQHPCLAEEYIQIGQTALEPEVKAAAFMHALALENVSDETRALIYRAFSEFVAGIDALGALRIAETASARFPDSISLKGLKLLQRAAWHMAHRKYDDAREVLLPALPWQESKDRQLALNYIGETYLRTNRYEEEYQLQEVCFNEPDVPLPYRAYALGRMVSINTDDNPDMPEQEELQFYTNRGLAAMLLEKLEAFMQVEKGSDSQAIEAKVQEVRHLVEQDMAGFARASSQHTRELIRKGEIEEAANLERVIRRLSSTSPT